MVYRPQERIFSAASATASSLSLFDLKRHLRVDYDDEDELISAMGFAADSVVEKFTQRLLTPRVCTLRLPGLPADQDPIELPGGAVSILTSVKVDGVAVTGCTVLGDSPAVMIPATSWGGTVATNYPVTVVYTAGFSAVPMDLQYAVKMIAADLFLNRSNSSEARLTDVPLGAVALMTPWRVRPI